MSNLKRRDFLVASIGGIGTLAASAGVHAAPAPESSVEIPSETHDVVVVGAGAAGVACAIEAKAQGADVVLLEKFCRPDGNTLYASGRICCAAIRRMSTTAWTRS